MCGITGFWDSKHTTTSEQFQRTLDAMNESLVHRGPDGANIWFDAKSGIGLAHRRLAILDLSAHGQQPMFSSSGRYVIIFNGEIYNHQQIKHKLSTSNSAPQWRGYSDTEIMLAAFEAWGIEQALTEFVGMFAIALWDKQQNCLYLIRDRMGEKPLYYGWLKNYLVFGSELKSLKAHFAWQQSISAPSVNLLMKYSCIPAPHTIYTDIYKLEPGTMLRINADQDIKKYTYWQLKDFAKPQDASYYSEDEQINILEDRLSSAVKQQMLADVPVGAFLSGGIDSSLIVALMQKQSANPVRTFTIGFEDAAYNEAKHAKAIAAHLQTQHTEMYLSATDSESIIPQLPHFYDEPFADSSQLATYMVAKLTRQHVTVSLSGDGGDELFAGYNRYIYLNSVWQKLSCLPQPMRIALAKAIRVCPPRAWNTLFAALNYVLPQNLRSYNAGDKLYKLAAICDADSAYTIYQKLIAFWEYDTQGLLPDLADDVTGLPLTAKMMYMDSLLYLPDDILVKVDRAGMAVSLETRMPFLDHTVVQHAWSLPLDLKMRNGQSKWILRQILHKHLPRELFERPKMGFGVPIDTWLRGSLKEWAQDLLSEPMLHKHNLLDQNQVAARWNMHQNNKGNWQHHLWNVLMFQAWYEEHHG